MSLLGKTPDEVRDYLGANHNSITEEEKRERESVAQEVVLYMAEQVSSIFGIEPHYLLSSRWKRNDIVRTRNILFWTLYKLGLTIRDIEREVGRDHSTVLRAVRIVQRIMDSEHPPVWRSHIMSLVSTDLSKAIRREIRDYPEEVIEDVMVYIEAEHLFMAEAMKKNPLRRVRGLQHILQGPRLLELIRSAFAYCDRGDPSWLIRVHAHRSGYTLPGWFPQEIIDTQSRIKESRILEKRQMLKEQKYLNRGAPVKVS